MGLFGPVPPVVADLRDVSTVRHRCAEILAFVRSGSSEHFTLAEPRAADVVERIAAITAARFPDLKVPYHSRWRHFGDRVPAAATSRQVSYSAAAALSRA